MAFCLLSSWFIDDFCPAYCVASCWTPISVRCLCCLIVESSFAEVSSCCASSLWVPSICSSKDAWLSTASGLPEVSRPMTDDCPEFSYPATATAASVALAWLYCCCARSDCLATWLSRSFAAASCWPAASYSSPILSTLPCKLLICACTWVIDGAGAAPAPEAPAYTAIPPAVANTATRTAARCRRGRLPCCLATLLSHSVPCSPELPRRSWNTVVKVTDMSQPLRENLTKVLRINRYLCLSVQYLPIASVGVRIAAAHGRRTVNHRPAGCLRDARGSEPLSFSLPGTVMQITVPGNENGLTSS